MLKHKDFTEFTFDQELSGSLVKAKLDSQKIAVEKFTNEAIKPEQVVSICETVVQGLINITVWYHE